MDEQQLLARMRRRILLDAAALCLVPVVGGAAGAGGLLAADAGFHAGLPGGALMGLALVMVFARPGPGHPQQACGHQGPVHRRV